MYHMYDHLKIVNRSLLTSLFRHIYLGKSDVKRDLFTIFRWSWIHMSMCYLRCLCVAFYIHVLCVCTLKYMCLCVICCVHVLLSIPMHCVYVHCVYVHARMYVYLYVCVTYVCEYMNVGKSIHMSMCYLRCL